MRWLEEVRNKPRAEKIKLIWRITGLVAIVLIVVWVLIGRYGNGAKKNTALFKTIGNGFSDFKLESPPGTSNNTNNQ